MVEVMDDIQVDPVVFPVDEAEDSAVTFKFIHSLVSSLQVFGGNMAAHYVETVD
jgi:hypothetical protein